MRFPMFLMVVATLIMAVLAARAYPNLNATSGIMAVPTAIVVPAGDAMWAADVLFQEDTTVNGRVVFGLAERLEVGAGFIAGEDTAFGLNAKYRLPAMIAGFAWAAGITGIFGDDIDEGMQIYATGTRPFEFGDGMTLLGTLGVNFTDVDTASAVRPFIGGQLQLGGGTEINGEFVFETGDFDESITSLFVRHRFSDRIVGQVGFTNAFGFTGVSDHDIFIGLALIERDAD